MVCTFCCLVWATVVDKSSHDRPSWFLLCWKKKREEIISYKKTVAKGALVSNYTLFITSFLLGLWVSTMKYVSVCYYLFFVYFSVCVRLHNPAVVWFNDRILQYIIVLDVPVLKQRKAARDHDYCLFFHCFVCWFSFSFLFVPPYYTYVWIGYKCANASWCLIKLILYYGEFCYRKYYGFA